MEKFWLKVLAFAVVPLSIAVEGAFAQEEGAEASYNGHTYVLFESGMPWSEAASFCEEQGGHLVTISSRGEQKTITTLMKSGSKKNYWIGGCKSNNKTGRFSWVTGEKFSFTDWNPGAPSDSTLGKKNSLVAYKSTGRWSDENGDKPGGNASNLKNYGFICEWEGPRSDGSVASVSEKTEKASGKASEASSSGMGISLYAGEKIQLYAPEGTKWTSSDHDVARVSQSGLVSALSAGTSVITAKEVGRITIRVEE